MQAYMDLFDTADWLKGELRVPLESFDLTVGEFRLLELLNREGAQFVPDAARRRRANLRNMKVMIKRLEGRGWVRRMIVALPPVPFEEMHRPKCKRGERRGLKSTDRIVCATNANPGRPPSDSLGTSSGRRYEGNSAGARRPTVISLCDGIFLTRGFYALQNSETQKHDRAHGDPVCGHVHQVPGVNQPADHDRKPNRVKSERHNISLSSQ
jgi:hypothetical protein